MSNIRYEIMHLKVICKSMSDMRYEFMYLYLYVQKEYHVYEDERLLVIPLLTVDTTIRTERSIKSRREERKTVYTHKKGTPLE